MRVLLLSFPSGVLLAASICSYGQGVVSSAPAAEGDERRYHSYPGQQNAKTAAMPTGSLTGTVLCSDTHAVARGAVVMVFPATQNKSSEVGGQQGMVRTGLDGTFTVGHLTAGEYRVFALMPGYISPLDGVRTSSLGGANSDAIDHLGKVVRVAANSTASTEVLLERGAAIGGHIRYSDGSPASQVTLKVESSATKAKSASKQAGGQQDTADMDAGAVFNTMFLHQQNTTDDQGHFRIAGLKPGTYRVAAVMKTTIDMQAEMAEIFGSVSSAGTMTFYSGNTFHGKDAKGYEVRGGDELADVEIVLPLNGLHKVSGVLRAKDGRELNSGSLTLTDTSDADFIRTTVLHQDGSYTFVNLPSGTYEIKLSSGGIYDLPPAMASVNLDTTSISDYGTKQRAAFAEATGTVIVAEADVVAPVMALTEVPVVQNPNVPGVPAQDD